MSDNVSDILEGNKKIFSVWFQVFMDNIHEFIINPNKFDRSTVLPLVEDVVLFLYTDSGYGKEDGVLFVYTGSGYGKEDVVLFVYTGSGYGKEDVV